MRECVRLILIDQLVTCSVVCAECFHNGNHEGHDCMRLCNGGGHEGWVGLGWVGLGWVGLGWVGLVGLGIVLIDSFVFV
jgi:hypothetical protein